MSSFSWQMLPQNYPHILNSIWDHHREPEEILVYDEEYQLTRKDFLSLQGNHWLNDEIINFYFKLIMKRSQENLNLPKVYAFNTFLYSNLCNKGYTSVKRWTRKIDIFSYDILIIPVHLSNHWALIVVDVVHKKVEYLDSLFTPNTHSLNVVKGYLEQESEDKRRRDISHEGWTYHLQKDLPAQKNTSDCGVFLCAYAELLTRNAPLVFTQSDMRSIREKMAIEVYNRKLLG